MATAWPSSGHVGTAALGCPPGRRPGLIRSSEMPASKLRVELCSTGQPRAAVPTCFLHMLHAALRDLVSAAFFAD